MSKDNGTVRPRRVTRKRPTDPVLYRGDVHLNPDAQLAIDYPGSTMAVMMFSFKDQGAVVWLDPRRIPVSRYELVKLWARRAIGSGRRFAALDIDDLHAVGLFQEAA